MTTREIAAKVIIHAEDNYSDGTGWDEIVECCSVDDLLATWEYQDYHPRTLSGAIRYVGKVQRMRVSYRNSILAEVF